MDIAFPIKKKVSIQHIGKEELFVTKIEQSTFPFTQQKTLFLFQKRFTIPEIATQRGITESTVWEHLTRLIEHRQVRVEQALPKEKIKSIRNAIKCSDDSLRAIKASIKDDTITYNEIACVLASLNSKDKPLRVIPLIHWYKKKTVSESVTLIRNNETSARKRWKD